MKNIKIAKNIINLLSRIGAIAYFMYIAIIIFMRAGSLTPISTDDVSYIFMYGTILGILLISNYSIHILYYALKKQQKNKIITHQ